MGIGERAQQIVAAAAVEERTTRACVEDRVVPIATIDLGGRIGGSDGVVSVQEIDDVFVVSAFGEGADISEKGSHLRFLL